MTGSLLTLEQAAQLAGYANPASLRQAIHRGTLSAHYEVINGRAVWMVTEDALRAYVAQRRTRHDERLAG